MAPEIDDALPSALDCRKQSAEMEAEKASEYISKLKTAEAEKKELLDRLAKPSGVSDEERMKRAAAIIKRAVDNGLREIEVGRFPNNMLPTKAVPSTSKSLAGKIRSPACRRSFINSGRFICNHVDTA